MGAIIENIDPKSGRLTKNRLLDRSTLSVFFAVVLISFFSAWMRDRLNRLPFAEEAVIAGHLIHGDGFLSPYDASPNAPPTCYSAPLYPMLIAAAYRVAGVSYAILVLVAFNSICFGLIAAGVFWLGRFYLSPLAGYLAALLVATNPLLLFFATDWWDSFAALAIFVALVVAAARFPIWRNTRRACAIIGAIMGVLSLFNPSYVLSFPLLVMVGLRRENWRTRFIGAALAFAGFSIVLLPWTIRNYRVFDRFYFVRGGVGLQMWMGNQPARMGWLDDETARGEPTFNENERRLILELGEPAYFDLCNERMKQAYLNSPGDFWLRSIRRFYFVFISDPTRAYLPLPMMTDVRWPEQQIYVDRLVLHGAMTLFGLTGVWTAWRLRFGTTWIFGAAILAEIPFVITLGSDRYDLPMDVILLLFAAILLEAVFQRFWCGDWPKGRIDSN